MTTPPTEQPQDARGGYSVWWPHFYVVPCSGEDAGYFRLMFARNFGYEPVTMFVGKDKGYLTYICQRLETALREAKYTTRFYGTMQGDGTVNWTGSTKGLQRTDETTPNARPAQRCEGDERNGRPESSAVSAGAAPLATGCTRSHPHELMSSTCELRTEIARLANENANLRAATADEVTAWVLSAFGIRPYQEEVADLLRRLAAPAQPPSNVVKRDPATEFSAHRAAQPPAGYRTASMLREGIAKWLEQGGSVEDLLPSAAPQPGEQQPAAGAEREALLREVDDWLADKTRRPSHIADALIRDLAAALRAGPSEDAPQTGGKR